MMSFQLTFSRWMVILLSSLTLVKSFSITTSISISNIKNPYPYPSSSTTSSCHILHRNSSPTRRGVIHQQYATKSKDIPSSSKTYEEYKEQLEAISFLSNMNNEDNRDDKKNEGKKLVERGQQVFDDMYMTWANDETNDDLEPTTEIYNLLIDIYANTNQIISTFEDDEGESIRMNGIEMAESILGKMEGQEDDIPEPDMNTFISVMKGWAKQGNVSKATSILTRIQIIYSETNDDDNDESIDQPTITDIYNELLSSFLQFSTNISRSKNRNRRNKASLNLVSKVTQEGENLLQQLIKPNTQSFYLVLSLIARDTTLSQTDEAVERANGIMDMMSTYSTDDDNDDVKVLDTRITNVRIKILGQSRGMKNAALEAEGILKDAIEAYKSQKKEQEVVDLSTRVDAASFINTINVFKFTKMKTSPQRATELLNLLEEFYKEEKEEEDDDDDNSSDSLKPDYRVYNAVQTVWARGRMKNKAMETKALLDKMIQLRDETDDDNYSPNRRSYNNVFNACAFTKGDEKECAQALSIAVNTFNQMRALEDDNDDVSPDHVSFGMFLKAVGSLMADGAKRETVIENVFRKCCRDGHVSEFVLDTFLSVSSPDLTARVLGSDMMAEDSIEIPSEWSRNV